MRRVPLVAATLMLALTAAGGAAQTPKPSPKPRPADVPLFPLPSSGLELGRPTRPGAFFDVLGRRAALFGYEHRGFEAWVYPLKILEDFRLSFSLEGYPLQIPAEEILATITTRPEATTFTFSHAAFTVRQIMFVPVDRPAMVMLLDVETTLRAYTSGAATALGVEREAGTIAPGRRADLVALSADPTAVDPERLGDVAIRRTWVGGDLRHSAA